MDLNLTGMEFVNLVIVGTKQSKKTQIISKRLEMDNIKFLEQKSEKEMLNGFHFNIKFSAMEKDIAKTKLIDVPYNDDKFLQKALK